MHLEIFVYLLCRFPGENRIYTVQRENSFTSGALPRNWPFVWSLKTVAVRTGIAIVSHVPIQDASLAETTPPRGLIQKAHLTVAKHPDCTHNTPAARLPRQFARLPG